jgi:hypothetical protein
MKMTMNQSIYWILKGIPNYFNNGNGGGVMKIKAGKGMRLWEDIT